MARQSVDVNLLDLIMLSLEKQAGPRDEGLKWMLGLGKKLFAPVGQAASSLGAGARNAATSAGSTLNAGARRVATGAGSALQHPVSQGAIRYAGPAALGVGVDVANQNQDIAPILHDILPPGLPTQLGLTGSAFTSLRGAAGGLRNSRWGQLGQGHNPLPITPPGQIAHGSTSSRPPPAGQQPFVNSFLHPRTPGGSFLGTGTRGLANVVGAAGPTAAALSLATAPHSYYRAGRRDTEQSYQAEHERNIAEARAIAAGRDPSAAPTTPATPAPEPIQGGTDFTRHLGERNSQLFTNQQPNTNASITGGTDLVREPTEHTPLVQGGNAPREYGQRPDSTIMDHVRDLPNWGKGLGLGAGALGAGALAHYLSPTEDDEENPGQRRRSMPWLGPLVGAGALGLGANYLRGDRPWGDMLTSDFWKEGPWGNQFKQGSYMPMVIVPYRIKLADDAVVPPPTPPIEPPPEPTPPPIPTPPTPPPTPPVIPPAGTGTPPPQPTTVQGGTNTPHITTIPNRVTPTQTPTPQPAPTPTPQPTPQTTQPPPSATQIAGMIGGGAAAAGASGGAPGAAISNIAARAAQTNPNAANPQVQQENIYNQFLQQHGNQPGLWDMVKHVWNNLTGSQQILVGAGLSLGALGLLGTLTGSETFGGGTGALMGLGGLAAAAYGSGAFEGNNQMSHIIGGLFGGARPQTGVSGQPAPQAQGAQGAQAPAAAGAQGAQAAQLVASNTPLPDAQALAGDATLAPFIQVQGNNISFTPAGQQFILNPQNDAQIQQLYSRMGPALRQQFQEQATQAGQSLNEFANTGAFGESLGRATGRIPSWLTRENLPQYRQRLQQLQAQMTQWNTAGQGGAGAQPNPTNPAQEPAPETTQPVTENTPAIPVTQDAGAGMGNMALGIGVGTGVDAASRYFTNAPAMLQPSAIRPNAAPLARGIRGFGANMLAGNTAMDAVDYALNGAPTANQADANFQNLAQEGMLARGWEGASRPIHTIHSGIVGTTRAVDETLAANARAESLRQPQANAWSNLLGQYRAMQEGGEQLTPGQQQSAQILQNRIAPVAAPRSSYQGRGARFQ